MMVEHLVELMAEDLVGQTVDLLVALKVVQMAERRVVHLVVM